MKIKNNKKKTLLRFHTKTDPYGPAQTIYKRYVRREKVSKTAYFCFAFSTENESVWTGPYLSLTLALFMRWFKQCPRKFRTLPCFMLTSYTVDLKSHLTTERIATKVRNLLFFFNNTENGAIGLGQLPWLKLSARPENLGSRSWRMPD